MSWSLKLLTVRGIDIKVHLTFVLILVWAAYRWGSPPGAGVTGAIFGVIAILLLFVAVLLHELGHSFQAMRQGVKVEDITLLPIGGLSRMEEIPEEPGKELRIALSGPVVNFAIAGVLVLIALLLRARAVLTLPELFQSLGQTNWRGMLAYLTMANLLLGVFNLIPAFPMDGGRILRALLALRLDHAKATSVAAAVGQGFALLIGLWGFATGGFTLILIAVFVWMGAGQEGRQAELKSTLNRMKVGQAMSRRFQVLAPGDTLEQAVQLTLNSPQADFPVMVNGRLVGLLTETDTLNGLRSHGLEAAVEQAMRADFLTVASDEPLFAAQQRMSAARARAAAVFDGDQMVGLLTTADINEAYRLLSVSPEFAPAESAGDRPSALIAPRS